MEKLNVIEEIGAYIENINFSNKAIYISHKYRTIFQVSRIVLIIGLASRVSGCSLLKLQFLSSALDDIEFFDRLEKNVVGGFSENIVGYWRYNKNVNNAIKYAIAEKLITTSATGLFVLTDSGEKMLESLNKEMVMMEDKMQLCRISKKLSERKLSEMIGKGIRI